MCRERTVPYQAANDYTINLETGEPTCRPAGLPGGLPESAGQSSLS